MPSALLPAETTSFIPLQLGEAGLIELISAVAIGLVNLFSNVLVDLIAVFLFFPNPSTIGGLDELWMTSLTAFVVIWMIAALSWMGTLEVFPYNENVTPWRFIDRSLIAFITVIISRPALTLLIELVDMIGRYIFPSDFGIALFNNGLQSGLGILTGTGALYMTALVILYSASTMVILLFLGVLSMRALMVYTIYATFPIWMALWIVDEGPLKFGNMISQVVFRGFAMLLAVGIFVSAILATGGAIAGYDNSDATATEADDGGRIAQEHLSTANYQSNGALSASEEAEVRNDFALRIIALFGSLWAAFGITSSMLGMMISVGGSAAARSSGRLQRGMPGGGGQTATDKGSPSGSGGVNGGGGGGGTPPGAMPGSHSHGPGEASGFVSGGDIPAQDGRQISEQVKMAGSAGADAVSQGMSDVSDTISDINKQDGKTAKGKALVGKAAETAGGAAKGAMKGIGKGFIGGAKAFDATAETLSTSDGRTLSSTVQEARDDPIIGGQPTSGEMLAENGAGFTDENGYESELDLDIDNDSYFHPDSAAGWSKADAQQQEVFIDDEKEMWRGHRKGSGGSIIVASANDVQGEAVHMTNNAKYQIESDTDLDLNTPYAEYDRNAGVVVADEKQGRSLEELDQHEEFARDDLDKQAYIDEVSASIIAGDERGANGDVLFDDDGKAFNPHVDGAVKAYDADDMERLAGEAAKTGIASKQEIVDRVEETSRQLERAHTGDEYTTGEPITEAARNSAHFTSKDIYDQRVADSQQKTIVERQKRLSENLRQAGRINRRKSK